MEISLSYTDVKNVILAKSLLWQYTEFTDRYVIFAIDGPLTYLASVYKNGYEPIGSPDVNDRADFETNYKSTANLPLFVNQQSMVQTMKPSYGSRAWTFSHNICDKTTWYGESIRVVDEAAGTGDGTTTTFNLAHGYVIDTTHGKITDENYLVPTASQSGDSYEPVIKVGGVVKTERVFGQTSGGDFTIDYAAGNLTFFTAPASAATIAATYFYSPTNAGSTMFVRPASGKKTIITSAECQFSADLNLTDTLISAIFTYNPYLGAPPAKFEYPGSRAYFKRMYDFISYTNGSYPVIPSLGGTTRGYIQPIYQLRFDYVVTIPVDDAYGAELRAWCENHQPFGGEQAQITFYGYQP